MVCVGASLGYAKFRGSSASSRYLEEVQEARLSSGNDAVDIANASKVCDQLRSGARPAGSELDQIGVRFFCNEFLSAFQVLEIRSVTGSFVLEDYKSAAAGCREGQGGYGDINSSTAVVVRSSSGAELARTSLGSARNTGGSCEWTFTFRLTEGEPKYIVSVGRRGETDYTWDEITSPGAIALSLG